MDIKAKYDPLLFKFPKGVVTKNTDVKFHIDLDASKKPTHIYFMIKGDYENEYKYLEMTENNGYEITYKFDNSGHYWYNFQLVFGNEYLYLNRTYENYSSLSYDKGDDYLQLITEKDYKCENSMQGGLIYQIFVDRFCRVGEVIERKPLILRDDWGGGIQKNTKDPLIINLEVFGGNINGIISKLDYLQKLGVTTIYLNPISQANSSHKYDTSDYMKIDDMFGTEEDFKRLVILAKAYGMNIVIDGVYNHTGSDSIYFNKNGNFDSLGAYQSPESKYYQWYDFENYPNKYKSWWGIDTLPSIRDNSEDFQNFIAGENGVLEKFLKLGVFGVRLDVVDEITDEFVKKIETKIHEFGENKVVMGEVWEDAATKESYSRRRKYFASNELNSVMNYPVKETVLDFVLNKNTTNLVSTLRMIENNYPKVVRDNLMNFLTTHDTRRVFSEILRCSNENVEYATTLYKIASILIFTLPGVPSIFYGDEYGMRDSDGSSRACFDWHNYKNDIYTWFLKLSKIRKHAVLKDGEINILYSDYGKFAFERVNDKERIVVIANISNSPLELNLEGRFISFLNGEDISNILVPENGFEILIETKNA